MKIFQVMAENIKTTAAIVVSLVALSSWLGFKSDRLYWHSDAAEAMEPINDRLDAVEQRQDADKKFFRLETLRNSLRMDGTELRDTRSLLSAVERDIASYEGRAVPDRLTRELNRLLDSLGELQNEMEAKRREIRQLEAPQ